MLESKQYFSTAVKHNNGFRHFGITPGLCCLYGDAPEDIINVSMTSIPFESTDDKGYWGYLDYSDNKLKFVYDSFGLLDMCFPCGVELMVEKKFGEYLRLDIKQV